MAKDPVFGMAPCWSCGAPTKDDDGPYTVGCPGCDPEVPRCEKARDDDTQELLHPEFREWKTMDEAIIDAAIKAAEDERTDSVDQILLAAMKRNGK